MVELPGAIEVINDGGLLEHIKKAKSFDAVLYISGRKYVRRRINKALRLLRPVERAGGE